MDILKAFDKAWRFSDFTNSKFHKGECNQFMHHHYFPDHVFKNLCHIFTAITHLEAELDCALKWGDTRCLCLTNTLCTLLAF